LLRLRTTDECEEIALEARAEVGLQPEDRLDPKILAEHLAIRVKPLDSYKSTLPGSVQHLTVDARSAFSAVTVYRGRRRLIVYNPAHSSRRHVNTIAHELAHVLLEHEPTKLFDENGHRIWIPGDEAEADYLAGALLVPLSAVVPVMDQVGENLVDSAEHFGVSETLMQHRVWFAEDPAWRRRMVELGGLANGKWGISDELTPRPGVSRSDNHGGEGASLKPPLD